MNILTRKLTIWVGLILMTTFLNAQTRKNSNDAYLLKEIDICSFVGKKYKMEVDIKCTSTDSLSIWGIQSLQITKDEGFIMESSKVNRSSIQNTEWKTFTIEGIILPNSNKIWMYLTISGNGDFYFDNLKFKMEDNNAWKPIEIDNADFEKSANMKSVLKEFENTKTLLNNPNIKTSIAVEGNNKSLYISSKNNVVSYQTIYGYNPAKGNSVTMKDGKKIYYETYGEGEPLMLFHGNGGSINSFKETIPELAKHYKVIAVDTRGQGKSIDNETENFSYELFADDMEFLIDELKLKKVNIVGWSDGGIIGLLLSIRHPDLVNKLVMMGANLNTSEEAISKKIIKQVQNYIEKLKKNADPTMKTTARLLEMVLKHPNIPVADLHKVKAKTLVLAGEKDLVLEKHTKLIAENIAHSTINIVKGETHFLPNKNAKLFNKIVLDFLLNN